MKINHVNKEYNAWHSNSHWADLFIFSHLFQSIQWEDDEPVEIAKVIGD